MAVVPRLRHRTGHHNALIISALAQIRMTSMPAHMTAMVHHPQRPHDVPAWLSKTATAGRVQARSFCMRFIPTFSDPLFTKGLLARNCERENTSLVI